MAQLVYAAAASHTAQLVRTPDKLAQVQRDAVYSGLEQIRLNLENSRPDVLVVFGADHFQSFHLDNMPAFCIGIGKDTETFGDAGVPLARYPMHESFAHHLAGAVLGAGIDVATSRRLRLDHAFASPLHFVLPQADIPLVPIVINSIAAPLAPLQRSYLLGRAVAVAISSWSGDLRVAVLGTGGLSHWVPIPHPDHPRDGSDAEIIEQMISGQDDPSRMTRLLLPRIARASDAGDAHIGEDFDREVIALLASGRASELAQRSTSWVDEHGGGGGQEIRNWLAVAGASADSPATLLAYEPVVPWLTGIAMMEWDMGHPA